MMDVVRKGVHIAYERVSTDLRKKIKNIKVWAKLPQLSS